MNTAPTLDSGTLSTPQPRNFALSSVQKVTQATLNRWTKVRDVMSEKDKKGTKRKPRFAIVDSVHNAIVKDYVQNG